jgi:hypothetical protein
MYIVQPPSGQQTTGWVSQQKPPFRYMNWLLYILDQWVQWFDFIGSNTNVTQTVTGTTSVASPNNLYLCNTTGSGFSMNLPTAASSVGYKVKFKNKWATGNNATVVPNGSDNIEGSNTSVILAPGDYLELYSDGTQWWMISQG